MPHVVSMGPWISIMVLWCGNNTDSALISSFVYFKRKSGSKNQVQYASSNISIPEHTMQQNDAHDPLAAVLILRCGVPTKTAEWYMQFSEWRDHVRYFKLFTGELSSLIQPEMKFKDVNGKVEIYKCMYHDQNSYHALRPRQMLMVKSVTGCTMLEVAIRTGELKLGIDLKESYHAFRPGQMLMVKSVTGCTMLEVAIRTGELKLDIDLKESYHAFRPGQMLMVKSVTGCTMLEVAIRTGGG